MRIFYLVKKEFIEIFRQKEILPLLFVAPLLQIIILGYVVKTDIEHVPVEIVNVSKNKHATRLINRMRQTPLFDVKRVSEVEKNVVEPLRKGEVKAVIVFRDPLDRVDPKTRQLTPLRYPEIQILMDGIDSNTSAIAAGYFNGIIKKYILDDVGRSGLNIPVQNRTVIRYNPRLKSINYMGPGIVALLLTILTLFLTSISLVREKEQQTMDTLLISRLTHLEIYIGKALPMAIIGLIQMTMAIGVVVLWFDIPVRGNLLYLLLSAVVFLSAILSYALLISTIASTQQQALFFSWYSMINFILLSGLFTPTQNVPPALRFLVTLNPLSYLIKIIREIFLKGNGIDYFYKDLMALAAIAMTLITISLLSFKRFISK
ncbi:MAG: ABC transporter permease [Candidatus Omnitrophota bacterium]